jgi:hypothetical protein
MQSSSRNEDRLRLISGDGVWQGEDGSRFSFSLDLEAHGRRCEGTIHWGIVPEPPHPSRGSRDQQTGTEYVRGSFDPATGEVQLYGYRLDNPALLSLDEYRLLLSPESQGFEGTSRGPWGTWRNVLAGQLRAG